MRFTSAFIASALAVAASAQTTTGSAEATTTWSIDPVQSSIAACLGECSPSDVNCRARCNPVPSPNEDQVNANNKCVAECPQGDGSPAATDKYAQCQAECITKYFYDKKGGTPKVGGGNDNSDNGDSEETGADKEDEVITTVVTESGVVMTKTSTNTAATSTETGDSGNGAGAMAGSLVLGAVAAALAL